jgi:hypothetical protein
MNRKRMKSNALLRRASRRYTDGVAALRDPRGQLGAAHE